MSARSPATAAPSRCENLPLTFIFTRPDGVEFARLTAPDLGGASHWSGFELPGNAHARHLDGRDLYRSEAAEPVAEQQFLVEDFVPDRIEFDLTLPGTEIRPGRDANVTVDGRFLYGAPAAALRLKGGSLSSTRDLGAFRGL